MNAIAYPIERRKELGSLGPYLQQQEQPRRDSRLSRIYDFGKEWLYEKPYEWIVRKPYIGWGLIGGILGALAAGPFGALVVGAMGLTAGTSLYWGWTRGERKPNNPEWLAGRSIGKYVADNLGRWFPRQQPQTRSALQLAYA